jgi:4-amino-4-deoxy-L-arabinose transferase-like glycosyltransferase
VSGAARHLIQRWEAWLAFALMRARGTALPSIVLAYVVFWSTLLSIGKTSQTIHFDTAEAYAWGQQLMWGYGKHPPISGWIAWAWYSVFPATDWSAYALAMAVTGVTVVLIWLVAIRTVDRRRALFAAALLLIYPVINFKGYKYNADLALMPFIVLVVLTFTVAFERRTLMWGIALGLSGAAAVLTKYWGAWAIAAVGAAAIASPDRKAFFRSPVVYAAGVTFLIALVPHVLWLLRDDFEPFRYAAAYVDMPRLRALRYALTGSGQVVVLLLPVAGVFAFALGRALFRRDNHAAPADRSRNLFVIAAVLGLAPPLAAALLAIRFRSDWAIPMYTLVPLALVALPGLTISGRAMARAAGAALIYCLGAAVVVPLSDDVKYRFDKHALLPKPMDALARQATRLWHERYGTPLKVVAGWEPFAAMVTYYSPDHPRLFTAVDPRLAPWIDTKGLAHTGFLGICLAGDTQCIGKIGAWSASIQRLDISTPRAGYGRTAPDDRWTILLSAPQPALAPAQ